MKCRICETDNISSVLDLGMMPAVNKFLDLNFKIEKKYPLHLYHCRECNTYQLQDIIPPDELFNEYYHLSRSSAANVVHLQEVASLVKSLYSSGRILEIGSNDGTLLEMLNDNNYQLLGIDPSQNIKHKIATRRKFYNYELAYSLGNEIYDVILALNVVAHTPDVTDLFRGIAFNLSPDGTFIMETAYISNLENGQFDTVYHEHVYTFSLKSIEYLCNLFALRVVKVEKIPTQGGSLRLFIKKQHHPVHDSVYKLRYEEYLRRNSLPNLYTAAQSHKDTMWIILNNYRNDNKKVVGIGAPARGVVMLNNAANFIPRLDYIVDDTPLKQNKLMPGVHIPVYSWDALWSERRSPACLLLSWNYKDSLVKRIRSIFPTATIIEPMPQWKIDVID